MFFVFFKNIYIDKKVYNIIETLKMVDQNTLLNSPDFHQKTSISPAS